MPTVAASQTPTSFQEKKSSDDFDWPWGAHTAVALPNGHILVFDNGYGRNFVLARFDDQSLYSRAVEYEVNEEQRTVRQVWQFGKEAGHKYYGSGHVPPSSICRKQAIICSAPA